MDINVYIYIYWWMQWLGIGHPIFMCMFSEMELLSFVKRPYLFYPQKVWPSLQWGFGRVAMPLFPHLKPPFFFSVWESGLGWWWRDPFGGEILFILDSYILEKVDYIVHKSRNWKLLWINQWMSICNLYENLNMKNNFFF